MLGWTTHVGGSAVRLSWLRQERRENRRRGVATRVFGVHTAAKMPGANQRLASLASQVQGYPQRNAVAAVRNPWRFRARCDRHTVLPSAHACDVSVCVALPVSVSLCGRVQTASAAYKAKNAKVLQQIGAVKVVPVIALDRAEDAVPLANALK